MEDSTLIAIVTVICSSCVSIVLGVVSHVLAVIKVRLDEKIYYEHRRIETLEKYFESVFSRGNAAESREFCKISGIVYLYVPSNKWHLLDKIYDAKIACRDDEAHDLARQLLDSMSRKNFKNLLVHIKKHTNRQSADQRN
ncbi:MAG: hypothetical protein IJ428_01185 [Clostridia bacterium]|nr:hypothetical protein [Clostridia bacterium]